MGVEPDPESVRLARKGVERAGMTDRITVRQGRAADAVAIEPPADRRLCFLTAFVLQEMLEQDGDQAVERLLRDVMDRHPTACWLVVEVDHQAADPHVMAHRLGQSYYNPYFLLHAITEQRLEPKEFWDSLFQRAGTRVAAFEYPDDKVDSTRLELGYLLVREPASGRQR